MPSLASRLAPRVPGAQGRMKRALLVLAALLLLPIAVGAGLLLCWLDGKYTEGLDQPRIPDCPRPEV